MVWSTTAANNFGFPTAHTVVGGVLVEHYTWPWIFWLNVPAAIVAFIGTLLFIPEIETEPKRCLDWFGVITLVVGVAAVQLMLNRAERLDWDVRLHDSVRNSDYSDSRG